MDTSDLAKRMKKYEEVSRSCLTPRTPLIIRLDGRSFHTYTKGFTKPFDIKITEAFLYSVKRLLKDIQGAKISYIQSDEVSILINDYEMFDTQSWFDKNLQKIVSISSSILTAYFNKYMESYNLNKIALFDSRAFVLPREEVCNYFTWRQLDAERNSVSSLAQSHFSHKELQGKKCGEMKQMLENIDVVWDSIPTWQKRGWCIDSNGEDFNIPRFHESRTYIEKHLEQIEK